MAHLHLGRCLLRWICQLQNDGHRRRSPCKVWPHHAASCWTVGPWGRWAVGPLGDTSWTDSVSESSLGTWCPDFTGFNSMTLDDSFWKFFFLQSAHAAEGGIDMSLCDIPRKGSGSSSNSTGQGEKQSETERENVILWCFEDSVLDLCLHAIHAG